MAEGADGKGGWNRSTPSAENLADGATPTPQVTLQINGCRGNRGVPELLLNDVGLDPAVRCLAAMRVPQPMRRRLPQSLRGPRVVAI